MSRLYSIIPLFWQNFFAQIVRYLQGITLKLQTLHNVVLTACVARGYSCVNNAETVKIKSQHR